MRQAEQHHDGRLPFKVTYRRCQSQLLAHRSDFTFDGVEYAPLMYKVIMHLATMDSIATTQTLRDNLQNLGTFAATVKGDIV